MKKCRMELTSFHTFHFYNCFFCNETLNLFLNDSVLVATKSFPYTLLRIGVTNSCSLDLLNFFRVSHFLNFFYALTNQYCFQKANKKYIYLL